ncbi:ADP-ribosylation factor-binding protein GGA3-like [Mugil cephalus]|uniref:ADP-ribosylation factor-binding protein GGA3-like n=1 Tax=Mugil cephalus TaxID=48193 RepID=UPI001FB7BF61|nr:ADP-ribosylation factor-binding protein GGA3-like [Mugil cephalus]XP_047433976.1 ADP-ribosylation factor-binding protein GGA3-like [Mugil cephalus]
MASGDNPATIESWLNQATDPNNKEDRWDCIQGFYQLVNQESDGPQVAIRLLAHKIQSPGEREALQALTVLEACMNNCGKRFHSEAAKFRFLNELIKVLTPKYFGAWTPQKVKDRVTEVLYGWTLWLHEEPKIREAYNMLKKQGIVKEDPKLPDTLIMAPPPQRNTESVFDQEDKAILLARLLKSNRPEDLEAANRLIKSTMKEEQEKAEKVSKRESTLKEVESSARELRALLDQQAVTGTSLELSDDVEALYERCDRLRPSLFRLASDTMDDDAALAQILAANDELTLVVNAYKNLIVRGECNGKRSRSKSEEVTRKNSAPTSPREIKSYHLIDLSALDSPPTHRKADSPPAFRSSSPVFFSETEDTFHSDTDHGLNELELYNVSKRTQEKSKSYYEELMQLNGDIQITNTEQNGGRGLVLRARGSGGNCGTSNGTNIWSVPHNQQFTESGSPSKSQKQPNDVSGSPGKQEENLLKTIFVPVETIKPSHLEPITLHDRAGVHVSLHFARDCPPGHPGVAVVVMSAVNTSALHVKDFLFQAAVPKTMSVKLQPASGTHLPPYNPLLPPPSVSQVLLLANPQRCKVRLRYKLTLTHGDQQLNETGGMDNFPEWTSLVGGH